MNLFQAKNKVVLDKKLRVLGVQCGNFHGEPRFLSYANRGYFECVFCQDYFAADKVLEAQDGGKKRISNQQPA